MPRQPRRNLPDGVFHVTSNGVWAAPVFLTDLDRLLAFEQSTLDAKKRLEALHRMQEILMEDAPALFLYGEPQIWAARKSLKGLDWNPLESLHPLHRAYFED